MADEKLHMKCALCGKPTHNIICLMCEEKNKKVVFSDDIPDTLQEVEE